MGHRPRRRPGSPLDEALQRVGDRWTLLVIAALLDGPLRFGDLMEALPGLAPNVLSQRLRSLEADALVVARAYSKRPPRAVYELTGQGRDLADVVRLLTAWGAGRSPADELPSHEACGTPLDLRWYCPSCDRVVEDDEAGEAHAV